MPLLTVTPMVAKRTAPCKRRRAHIPWTSLTASSTRKNVPSHGHSGARCEPLPAAAFKIWELRTLKAVHEFANGREYGLHTLGP